MTLTKTAFRKKCLQKLKNSPKHNELYKTHLINKRLMKELSGLKNKKILFYYPLSMEANIIKTLIRMRKTCDVYIPFMEGESFKVVPFRLPLKKKKFDIFEAGNTHININKFDIAIVPAVGVDGDLKRIGFGKGMYDRFFEKLKKKPYTIFLQHEICYTNKFICDEHDIACDLLLTPTARISKSYRVKTRK